MTELNRMQEALESLSKARALEAFGRTVVGKGRLTVEWRSRYALHAPGAGTLAIGEETAVAVCDAIGSAIAREVLRLSENAKRLLEAPAAEPSPPVSGAAPAAGGAVPG